MNNILQLLKTYSAFLTWLVLTVYSIILLSHNNPYQRSIMLGSANAVVGSLYETSNSVTGYFGLRDINEDLLARTGQLEAENLRLRELLQLQEDQLYMLNDTVSHYRYTMAHVVNNSITQAENYITLDKGSLDGIRPDLGVADQNGVVGIIARVSDHFSVALSILNPKLGLSVMIKNTENFGSLVWDGADPRYALLKDLPRNVKFEKGDTVVTTGYSTSFPHGVPVGRIEEAFDAEDNNFLTLRISLFTDFDRINDVHVIINDMQEEQKNLEAPKKEEKK